MSSPVSGRSTLTTSAPWSARIIAHQGPDRWVVRSSTRMWERDMVMTVLSDVPRVSAEYIPRPRMPFPVAREARVVAALPCGQCSEEGPPGARALCPRGAAGRPFPDGLRTKFGPGSALRANACSAATPRLEAPGVDDAGAGRYLCEARTHGVPPMTARNLTLDVALAEAEARYAADNPASAARYEDACRSLPGGNTRTVLFYEPFPLSMAKGEGARLRDLDGHEYRDFLGEHTAGLYGHSNPRILDEIRGALASGIVLGAPNRYEVELAELVCARFSRRRPGTVLQFRDGGEPDGHRARPGGHGAREGARLRGRVPRWGPPLQRGRERTCERAVSLRLRPLQRHGGDARGHRVPRERARGHPRRADDGVGWLHRGGPRVSRGLARSRRPPRGAPPLRRG